MQQKCVLSAAAHSALGSGQQQGLEPHEPQGSLHAALNSCRTHRDRPLTPNVPHARTHRKKKAVHKTTSTDDKRLQNTLKRLGVNTIPGIEEVNIFKESSDVVHFTNPKGELSSPVLRMGCVRAQQVSQQHSGTDRPTTDTPATPMLRTPLPVARSASLHCSQHLRHQWAITNKE